MRHKIWHHSPFRFVSKRASLLNDYTLMKSSIEKIRAIHTLKRKIKAQMCANLRSINIKFNRRKVLEVFGLEINKCCVVSIRKNQWTDQRCAHKFMAINGWNKIQNHRGKFVSACLLVILCAKLILNFLLSYLLPSEKQKVKLRCSKSYMRKAWRKQSVYPENGPNSYIKEDCFMQLIE